MQPPGNERNSKRPELDLAIRIILEENRRFKNNEVLALLKERFADLFPNITLAMISKRCDWARGDLGIANTPFLSVEEIRARIKNEAPVLTTPGKKK